MKSILSTLALVAVASAATIDVKVGDGGLTIEPSTINAEQGDDVVFHFWPGNHDVAAGPFDSPCSPSNNGFYSGLINTDGSQPDATFTVRINNTNPIWLYCTTRGHCQGGMSAVINPPPNGNTIEDYKAASENANSVRPQQVRGGIFNEKGNGNGAKPSGSGATTPSSTPSATGAAGTGAASALFTEETMLFNVFAAVVAGGAGFLGLL
ncbi:hypothetical protein AJ79_08807 [Helicocarpus griseus UAMH5409]|uniref:Phytocyanin domain-containing protein n=1 Tax=Helicocarpus griseus UAMH5409 TaxID=1447875 RepID=A0A2B7WPN5_9EURO|nr:hypothetical protein AJ79_08807 [Helicocarpus griseus UAMH5409]